MVGWKFKFLAVLICLLVNAQAIPVKSATGPDYPHSGITSTTCLSCHYNIITNSPPVWFDSANPYDQLCQSCHNDDVLPDLSVSTHSANNTSTRYGNWVVECRTCHWPHWQQQYRTYGADSYVYSGNSTGLNATTLTMTGAGWENDQFNDYILVPNTDQTEYNYRIVDTTSDTLEVEYAIDTFRAAAGDTFAIFYGKLIRDTIATPNSGEKTVRFFGLNGTNSFVDGDATYDGICEICHTRTIHFRNDGNGTDQLHSNVGDQVGKDCMSCHLHRYGFAHGKGGGGGGDCGACHGEGPLHDAATPGSDYVVLFAENSHDDAMEGAGAVYVDCLTCHNNELNLNHGGQCSICHPSPKNGLDTWTGGCQQGGCHQTKHAGATAGHNTVVDDCSQCHGQYWEVSPSVCPNCHATFSSSDTTPPATTSNAQSSYIGSGYIEFDITEGGKVGIGTTFYRVDGGEPQTGSSAVIASSGNHTLEFWSVDQAGNVETPANTATFEISEDTTPPVTTSNAQASYYSRAAYINLTPTDNSSPGVKATYYTINDGPLQTGTYIYIADKPGTYDYILRFWSEDWSGNVEEVNTVEFSITGGTGTIRLIAGNSDTNGSPCTPELTEPIYWTVKRGTTVVATGSAQCPDWSGVDEITVPVSLAPYNVTIEWWDYQWEYWDQSYFGEVYLTTHGDLVELRW